MSNVPYVSLRNQPIDKEAVAALYEEYGSGMHKTQPDCDHCEYAYSTMLCDAMSQTGGCPTIPAEIPD